MPVHIAAGSVALQLHAPAIMAFLSSLLTEHAIPLGAKSAAAAYLSG